MIERIIVHKTLIDSFKRKAVKALPNEIIVAVLGKMEKNDLHVYAFDKLEVVKSKHTFIQYEQPEEELYILLKMIEKVFSMPIIPIILY
jgi:hypothetical protein